MILSAIYISEHFLFENPQIVNFGGKFIFDFKIKDDKLNFFLEKNENQLDNYFGDISMVSAIVGPNGAGKTSLLRILNQGLDSSKVIFFYEEDKEILILNHNKISLDKVNFEYTELHNTEKILPLYYSPNLDFDLIDIYSPISPSRKFKDSLSEYYLDNLESQLIFLNDPKINDFKSIYNDLPTFEKINVKVNNFSKSRFLDLYKEANLGKSLNIELEMLWKKYKSHSDLIHDDDDFLKSLKIMLLSMLVLDDIFTQTNDNGFDIGFEEVIQQDTFTGKLNKFLEKRLNNIDSPSYETLNEKIGINIENADKLIKEVKSIKISQITGGFDFNMIKRNMISCISSYETVYNFYNFIRQFNIQNRIKTSDRKEFVEFDVKDFNDISKLIYEYKKLISAFKNQSIDFRILNFSTDKKFSTGEKSLLDFFSSINYFVINGNNYQRQSDNYLLLLDEPEQGYHALWKKKFISAIIKVIPLIFSELSSKPKIQIIFTTHDPLTLSDIPNNNLILLDKNTKRILSREETLRRYSFGANISDILADSFFIGDGLIGEYVKDKIQDVINYLDKDYHINNLKWIKYPNDAKKIIESIGEPFLKDKLNDMFLDKFQEYKKMEVLKLQQKIKDLEK